LSSFKTANVRFGWILLVVAALGTVTLARGADVSMDDPLWWLTNQTPPHVVLDGPSGTVRGQVVARLVVEPAGHTRIVSVRLDDQPRSPAGEQVVVDTATVRDGQHRVEVVVHDTSRRQNLASATWTFVSDNTPQKLELSLDPSEGPQEGHTALLRLLTDEPVQNVQAALNGTAVRLQSDGSGGFWMLAGISPGATEENWTLRVAATDAVGNPATVERSWATRHTTFVEDDLALVPSAEELQAHLDEDRRLAEIYRRVTGTKLWDGAFKMPLQGDETTAFGTHRSYEFHPGVDFAATQGTPVSAPAAGVVVFVGDLPARGNVVILDHGVGVFTTYAHLQQWDVEVGADVKPGQAIGRVGTTGFSTGPHLHWELWVDGANVDPLDWTKRAYP